MFRPPWRAPPDPPLQGFSLPVTKSTSAPTVTKVSPSMSSSSTKIPKRSSRAVIRLTTAIESSSGMAPKRCVLQSRRDARSPRLKTSPSTAFTSANTSMVCLLFTPDQHCRQRGVTLTDRAACATQRLRDGSNGCARRPSVPNQSRRRRGRTWRCRSRSAGGGGRNVGG